MDISIIIPAYNSERTIQSCLEGISRNKTARNFEVIVVDDGSSDSTKQKVEKFSVSFFQREHRGQASALNYGAKQAKGEILIFLDSDCAPTENWMENMAGPLYAKPEIGATLGVSIFADNVDDIISWWTHWLYKYALRGLVYSDHASTYSLAVRAEVFNEIGGFREEIYKAPCQFDVEFGFQLSKRKFKILIAREAKVYHYHATSLSGAFRKQMAQARWIVPLILRNRKLCDDYSRSESYVKVLFPAILILSIPLVWLSIYPLVFSFIICLLAYFKTAIWVVRHTKRIRDFNIVLFQFLISFAWILGILQGLYLTLREKISREVK